MDTGTVNRDRFAASLRDERGPVWVRAIVGPVGRRRAPLYASYVFVGPQPPGWQEATWRYESCTFIALRTTPRRLAAALETGELALGSLSATFTFGPGESWQWRREPSYARLDRFGIPWPTTAYELALAGLEQQQLPERLVGRGALHSRLRAPHLKPSSTETSSRPGR
jgi:hypothetical protein